jgi:haloalkane dehalogenase
VLLVHGNPTWGFYYRSLLAALPPLGLRAIAPDHIGMGRSEKPSTAAYPHTLARRVADFGEFVDGLALTEPLSLVVHDWGGAIALAWAVDNVERVDKLLVLNTGAFPIPPGKALPWSLAAARVPVLGGIAVRGLNAFSRGALVMGTGRPVLGREARAGLTAPYDSPAHRTAVHEFVRDIPSRRATRRTPCWPAPSRGCTCCRTGRRRCAGGCRTRSSTRWCSTTCSPCSRGEVHRYADAGHYVLEDAADRIVPIATRLLAPA